MSGGEGRMGGLFGSGRRGCRLWGVTSCMEGDNGWSIGTIPVRFTENFLCGIRNIQHTENAEKSKGFPMCGRFECVRLGKNGLVEGKKDAMQPGRRLKPLVARNAASMDPFLTRKKGSHNRRTESFVKKPLQRWSQTGTWVPAEKGGKAEKKERDLLKGVIFKESFDQPGGDMEHFEGKKWGFTYGEYKIRKKEKKELGGH